MIERNDFEAAMWDYYLGLKAKGWSAPEEGERVPPALFWLLKPNNSKGLT